MSFANKHEENFAKPAAVGCLRLYARASSRCFRFWGAANPELMQINARLCPRILIAN